MEAFTVIAVAGIAATTTMFCALVRQTMRAERLEAALARVEAVIAEVAA